MTKKQKHPLRLVIVALLASLMIPALAAAQTPPPLSHHDPSFHPSAIEFVDPLMSAAAVRGAEAPADRYFQYRAWLAGLHRKTVAEVRARRAASPRYTVSAPAVTSGSVNWYAIAACESGDRWDLNTGNGYWGGLQFAPHTWFANGGGPFDGVGPFPYSAAQQIAVAERVLASQGIGAWPYCGRFG